MAHSGDPFGAPAGNPFDAFGSPPKQGGGNDNPFDAFAQPPVAQVMQGPGVAAVSEPFLETPQPQQYLQQQQQQQQYPAPQSYQAPVVSQQLVPAQQLSNPYALTPAASQPSAVVDPWAPQQPQQQQTIPPPAQYNAAPQIAAADPWAAQYHQGQPAQYAAAPQPAAADPWASQQQTMTQQQAPVVAADPFGGPAHALVPVVQQSSPWAQTPAPAQNPFDPFAAAPSPPPAPPAQPPAPMDDPFSAFTANPPADQQQGLVPFLEPAPSPYALVSSAPEPAYSQPPDHNAYHQEEDNGQVVAYQQGEEPPPEHVNKYSAILANTAPANAAPLPQGERVVKSGYVLSRISFRTILLKKWKQSYWVQYGPHTMLWFRSHDDFNDWLNNPYLTQQQRNFLIKLAVNFVHDLYKPNVRGYQVTQARSKQYKRKYLKQFKLERWMDYGPTIAAAFASTDAKEVDVLRQTLVECMRNTPTGDGIRATGAVRQDNQQQDGNDGSGPLPANHGYPAIGNGGNVHGSRSVASAHDVRDDHRGFDDSASLPANFAHGSSSQNGWSNQGPPKHIFQEGSQQHQPNYQQAPPQQQQSYGQPYINY